MQSVAVPGANFETMVLTHHDEVHRYLCRLTARVAEAEDLTQETFLRALRAWPGLPPGASHRAWLYTIATNAYRNRLRTERRRRAAHETVRVVRAPSDRNGPEAAAVAVQLRNLVEAAVRRLPIKQRLAFTLRKLEDLDYDAIGSALDCSPESARAHVFQALRKIRTVLDDHAPHPWRRTQ